jgi:hypothetical protein
LSTVTPAQLPTFSFLPVKALYMVVLPLLGLPAKAILIFHSSSFQLPIANLSTKDNQPLKNRCRSSDNDRLCQLIINIVSSVLDGYSAISSAAGYHRNGFTTVAAKGKQEAIELLVIGLDALDDVFLTFLCSC